MGLVEYSNLSILSGLFLLVIADWTTKPEEKAVFVSSPRKLEFMQTKWNIQRCEAG